MLTLPVLIPERSVILTDPLFYLVAVPAIVILGLSKGGFAGVGMVSTPLVALVTGPVEAAGILLPVLIAQDGVALWMYRRSFSGSALRVLIPGAAIGIVLAYLLAASVREAVVAMALGIISILFAAHQLWRMRGKDMPEPGGRQRPLLGLASGIGSGFTSTIAHAGTPPFQFYVLPLNLEKEKYIGTSVVFFASVNAMKIPAFAALGQFTPGHLTTAAVLLPLALASSWLGVRLVRLVDPQRFRVIIALILGALGVALLASGLRG